MEWLTEWPRFGIEGLCMKSPNQSYRPGYRGWLKYRIRARTEAVITVVTGSIETPETLLLARFDETGRLRYVARTSPLTRKAAAALAPLLALPTTPIPCTSAGLGRAGTRPTPTTSSPSPRTRWPSSPETWPRTRAPERSATS